MNSCPKGARTEDRFSNSISAIVYAEDLCSYIKARNNKITFAIFVGENFFLIFGASTSQSVFSVFRFRGLLVTWTVEH